jgi:radical SAM superfamily enzyme YgiQ (UPF0313 family)
MADVPQVCEGLHLPVQSGSTSMLKKMQRNYTREGYLELVAKLRRAMPDITISTDLIVGYPGESEADFRETLSLVEEVGFDFGFVFKYSPRAGTPAAALEGYPEEPSGATSECPRRRADCGRETRALDRDRRFSSKRRRRTQECRSRDSGDACWGRLPCDH